jgi:hypothetical protein
MPPDRLPPIPPEQWSAAQRQEAQPMPQRWFIRNTSTDPLTGRKPRSSGHKNSIGHVAEITGHVAEFGGHDAETVGHALPKYAPSEPAVYTICQ